MKCLGVNSVNKMSYYMFEDISTLLVLIYLKHFFFMASRLYPVLVLFYISFSIYSQLNWQDDPKIYMEMQRAKKNQSNNIEGKEQI